MKTLFRNSLITLITVAIASIANAATTFTLNGLGTFGPRGDGSVQPVSNVGFPAGVSDSIGFSPYTGYEVRITAQGTTNAWFPNEGLIDARTGGSTNGFNMRGLTYDPVSGNVILVDTHSGTSGSNSLSPFSGIYVLDPNSGLIKAGLSTNGIAVGSYVMVPAGVADDGVVYIANQTTASFNNPLKIYRWPTADTNNPGFTASPTLCFSNLITTNFGYAAATGERLGETMDARGSGTNTLLILGSSSLNGIGKSVFLFDTTDGTNFAAHRIEFDTNVITGPVFNDGVAFGPGNTFWAKQVGKPFLYCSWDDAARATGTNRITGAVISSFTASSPNDPLLNISAIAYDPVNKLLAGLEEIGGTATGGRGKVWLFHMPDPTNHAPSVLASRTYTPNFVKATAPMGYLHFGSSGTRLYANVVNNGMLASTVDSVTLNPPTFTENLPATTRVVLGQTAHFEVLAVQDVTNYQWFSNNVTIAGANSYYIDVPTTTTNQTGIQYKVIAFNAAGSTESVHSVLTVVTASQFFHPQLLWSKTANGTALTDPTNFITSGGGGGTPNERTIAYDANNNRLVVVRGPSALSSLKIFVLDAHSGAFLWLLGTNGITTSGALTLCGCGVADDGAFYASSASSAGTSDASFKVYRWPDTESNQQPQVIFGTNSSGMNGNPYADLLGSQYYRSGDNLAVRGGGTGTELVVDSQNSSKYAAILTPTDGTLTNWTQKGHLLQNILGSYGSEAYGTAIGRSLLFGSGNTFWQKRYNAAAGSPFAEMGYTPGVGNDVIPLVLANSSLSLFTNGPMAIHPVLKLGASVNFVGAVGTDNATLSDTLNFFDLTDPSQAVLLFTDNLPGGNSGFHKANNNAVAQVAFGSGNDNGTNYLFILNGNNGVSAYALVGGSVPPPTILAQPHNLRVLQGSSGSLTVLADQPATVRWYKGTNPPVNTTVTGNVYSVTNAQVSDSGDYFCTASNANGMVTSQVAHATVSLPSDNYSMAQAWAAAPAVGNYVTSDGGPNTPNERAFAYNALSNELVVVRCPPASTAYTVSVVNASSGVFLHLLNTSTVVHQGASEVSGSNPIDLVGAAAADDGAIYVCSESPNASGGANGDTNKMMRLYRWANTDPSTVPVQVFAGDPASQSAGLNFRWGDVLTARGSGTNTELFLNSFDGTLGAVLKPTDATLNTFTNYWFTDVAGGGSIGRSVEFGAGNTVFEKRKGTVLVKSSYDLVSNSELTLLSAPSSDSLGGVWVDTLHNLMAGVDFVGTAGASPDAVSLYDITDPGSPMLLNRVNFPVNAVANANVICTTIISGSRGWSLDANNGIVAFTIVGPKLSVVEDGSKAIVSWGVIAGQNILQATPSLVAPATWTNVAPPAPISVVNGRYTVTNSISGAGLFYRLVE
jgi:hypothetical protein